MNKSNQEKIVSFIQKSLPLLLISILFLTMGIALARFLNWGDINYNYLDWSEEGPRYVYIQNALKQRQLPLHIDSPMAENERFIGIADTLLVPQFLLINLMSSGQFIVFNTLINYALGFYFMLLLKKRLNWSLGTFLMVTPLAMFNGYILSHLAVGHSMWVNAFLMPLLVLLFLDFPQDRVDWTWNLHFSLFCLFMFLQGGFHFVLWSLGFVLLYAITKKSRLKPAMIAVLFGALISMIRILPTSVTYVSSGRRFIAGFRTLTDLFLSLIQIQLPEYPQALLNSGLPVWETDYYIGLLGTAFIIVFGLILPILKNETQHRLKLSEYWFPMIVITILSIGQIWRFTNYLSIPFSHAERVSSRFFYVPLSFLLIIAGETFNHWQAKFKQWPNKTLLISGTVLIILHDLFQNARLWRVDRLDTLFTKLDVPVIANVVTKHDPPYITAIIIGCAVSTITLILLIILSRRKQKEIGL